MPNHARPVVSPRHLCSPETIYGKPVVDCTGHQIGSVNQLLLDLRRGRVAYAVVASGGFLGLGETRFPVAWAELELAPDGSRLVWHRARAPGPPMPASVPAALLGP